MGTGKTALVIMILANLAGTNALCRPREVPAPASSRTARLDVYLVDLSVPFPMVAVGKMDAARIFGQIGVSVRWHTGNPPKEAGSGRIAIRVGRAPASATSGALGAASLSERVIALYIDRIQDLQARMPNAGRTFGYVLAHEIGHVLQGVPRHSEAGILRGTWTGDDYANMSARQLTFAPQDVEQIWRGPVLNQTLSTLAFQGIPVD
jgi:hypothetical protein